MHGANRANDAIRSHIAVKLRKVHLSWLKTMQQTKRDMFFSNIKKHMKLLELKKQ